LCERFVTLASSCAAVDDGRDDDLVLETRLLYSADGTVWVDHPDPPAGAVLFERAHKRPAMAITGRRSTAWTSPA
jgi:hypothetical protein